MITREEYDHIRSQIKRDLLAESEKPIAPGVPYVRIIAGECRAVELEVNEILAELVRRGGKLAAPPQTSIADGVVTIVIWARAPQEATS